MDSVKKQCYDLVQEIVLMRDISCRAPGCVGEVSTAGHHIFGRGNLSTAFDLRYVWGMCLGFHGWAHRQPDQFREWVISSMGEEQYYTALRLSNTVVKNLDFEEIRDGLRAIAAKFKLK